MEDDMNKPFGGLADHGSLESIEDRRSETLMAKGNQFATPLLGPSFHRRYRFAAGLRQVAAS
jgi:hypothetical protein